MSNFFYKYSSFGIVIITVGYRTVIASVQFAKCPLALGLIEFQMLTVNTQQTIVSNFLSHVLDQIVAFELSTAG